MDAHEPNRPRVTPLKYLGILVVLMAASAWLALSDRLHRPHDEATELPTGLGDRAFHPRGTDRLEGDDLAAPMAYFKGRPLFPRARVTNSYVDTAVGKVGLTDDGSLAVYRPLAPESQAKLAPGSFLLKTGPDPQSPGRSLFREVGQQKYGPD